MQIAQTTTVLAPDMPALTATAEQIEAQPMFYNADLALWLSTPTCPLTTQFIDVVGEHLDLSAEVFGREPTRWSLDTRSHMLMRGWYPAIPGWHHDDVDRGLNGQPNYDGEWLHQDRRMFVCVVDADDQPTGSLTEFISDGETVSVPWPVPDDDPVYRYWDAHIEREVDAKRTVLRSGVIYEFNQASFHRAMPATSNGWRWFARLIVNPGPRPARPKVRRQTQVYLPTTNLGW